MSSRIAPDLDACADSEWATAEARLGTHLTEALVATLTPHGLIILDRQRHDRLVEISACYERLAAIVLGPEPEPPPCEQRHDVPF